MSEDPIVLRIGELAHRAGLSVRALHHYDAIGLLSPSVRSASGARRYAQPDLVRLHRIQALKQLGYSLPDIRACLDQPRVEPLAILARQIEALEQQAHQSLALRDRLKRLVEQIAQGQPTATTDWLNVLELMTVYQRHLSDAELRLLRHPVGHAAGQLDAQWAQLVQEVDQAMQRPLPPSHASAQVLAWRWVRLVIAMTSNDAALANKLMTLQRTETRAQQIVGIHPAMLDWIGQALAHARTALFAKHLSPAHTAEVQRRQLAALADLCAWPSLVATVRAHMVDGTPIDAPPVQALMQRWHQLFRDSYCGDDADLESRVRHAFAQEPDLMLGVGVDEALMRYVHEAQDFRSQAGANH